MQVSGAVQGASTVHPRRGLNALLASAAIVVIAAVVALVVWVLPLATSGDGTEYFDHNAGLVSGVQAGLVSSFHSDAGNIPSGTGTTRVPGSGGVPAVTGTTRVPGSGLD